MVNGPSAYSAWSAKAMASSATERIFHTGITGSILGSYDIKVKIIHLYSDFF
jgi:hypothetical protein